MPCAQQARGDSSSFCTIACAAFQSPCPRRPSAAESSGGFITIEANKLAERGILQKASDPTDGRRVLLKNTSRSLHLLERLAPHQRRINDVLFERLDARRFRQLRALARDLVASGDRAVAMLEFLLHEAQAA